MRAIDFIAEAKLETDNPGGAWLASKQQECRKAGSNQYGAPKYFGPVTGYYSTKVLLPISVISKIHGVMGEQNRTREDSLAWLVKEMGDNNRLPLFSGDKQYCPFITVDYKGIPWVNEGNHRIKAATQLEWKYLPIEVRYFSGGEQANGILSPEKVNTYDAQARAEGYVSDNNFQGKLSSTVTESVSRFYPIGKQWVVMVSDHVNDQKQLPDRNVNDTEIARIEKRIPYLKPQLEQMKNFKQFYIRDHVTGVELGCRIADRLNEDDDKRINHIVYVNTVIRAKPRRSESPIIFLDGSIYWPTWVKQTQA